MFKSSSVVTALAVTVAISFCPRASFAGDARRKKPRAEREQ
jgi:hypothetical protein